MANFLDPTSEITVSALSATLVYSVFNLNAPSLSDVRYDEPGNTNTYKSVNQATWTSAAMVAGLALLTKSPTVAIIGGAMTLFETWKYHYANFAKQGSQEAPTLATS